MANEDNGTPLTWDDGCESEFNVMPEDTEVTFTVKEIIKGRNEKRKCPSMKVIFKCTSPDCGETTVEETYNLTTKAAYFMKCFFVACGLQTAGKSIAGLVAEAQGKTGYARLRINSWEYNGLSYSNNRIKEFLSKLSTQSATAASADNGNEPW